MFSRFYRWELALLLAVIGVLVDMSSGGAVTHEVRRFPAEEARQAVAVDATHFYAIDNAAIGKYEKATGKRVARWAGPPGGAVTHLNSGVVVDGTLYCAHSNYPEMPATSSIEMYDTQTMEHVASHSFGIASGWATWVDRYDGAWWVVFARYNKLSGETGKGTNWTTLVRFDRSWRRTGGWVFPEKVLARFGSYSNSGGSWGAHGLLYATGHEEPELYVLRLPGEGSVLQLVGIMTIPNHGQGIAWDRSESRALYVLNRPTREVLVLRFEDGPVP